MIDHLITEIAAKYNLRQRHDRHLGPCPKCGGSDKTDRFQLRDDGGFKCYSCGYSGKIERLLRDCLGYKCPEAYAASGNRCDSHSCPVGDTCRQGNGSVRSARRPVRSALVPPTAAPPQKRLNGDKQPSTAWQTWAAGLVAAGRTALDGQPAVKKWLQARGIDAAATAAAQIGWQSNDTHIDRAKIGLSPERDGKTALWIPRGLIIPTYTTEGELLRLRIRRTDEDRQKFLPDLKYYWVEGSGDAPMLLLPPGGISRGVVIIEAEMDAIATAAAHNQVTVIALGTVNTPLTAQILRICAEALVLLIALDADAKDGAGPKAAKDWSDQYRQAIYWPVPTGKDPGDYVRDHNGDLGQWIEAGLVPLVNNATGQDQSGVSLQDFFGGEGGNIATRHIGGIDIYFPRTPDEWRCCVLLGLPCIGPKEIQILLDNPDAYDCIDWLIEIKSLFPGAFLDGVYLQF